MEKKDYKKSENIYREYNINIQDIIAEKLKFRPKETIEETYEQEGNIIITTVEER